MDEEIPKGKGSMDLIRIGTSGWSYKEWAGGFYRGLKSSEQFHYYTTRFSTVEINATFYRLPALKTVHGWREQAPPGFVFAVKGSRFITHIKRLDDLGRSVSTFVRRVQPLGEKLGPLLWQLPPSFRPDFPRLEEFLRRLPKAFSHAIEFRHPDWMREETFNLLRKHNAAFVSVSSLQMPQNFSVTADFIYLRFHGLEGRARHDYTPVELEPWAEHLRAQATAGKGAFAYFNNDVNVRAPHNAQLLRQLCGAG